MAGVALAVVKRAYATRSTDDIAVFVARLSSAAADRDALGIPACLSAADPSPSSTPTTAPPGGLPLGSPHKTPPSAAPDAACCPGMLRAARTSSGCAAAHAVGGVVAPQRRDAASAVPPEGGGCGGPLSDAAELATAAEPALGGGPGKPGDEAVCGAHAARRDGEGPCRGSWAAAGVPLRPLMTWHTRWRGVGSAVRWGFVLAAAAAGIAVCACR